MKHIQKILFIFSLLIFTAILTMFAHATGTHAQQAQYPIPQLGNCRDAKECFYYCQIPSSFPSCWSYNKYILNKNVLGESTQSPEEVAREHGVTFPIAELGNCSSPQACMQYCNQPANESACTDFGKKKGLIQDNTSQNSSRDAKVLVDAKAMLGCTSKQACMEFCNNPANQQMCEQFAEKEGFTHQDNQQIQQNSSSQNMPQITTDTMKQELGCDSQTSCMDFCNNPDNYSKCQAFADKYHLNSGQQPQNSEQTQSYPSNMSTPPCTDQQSCMQWCKDNPDKCNNMQSQQNNSNQQYNSPTDYLQSVSPYPSMGIPQNYPTYSSPQSGNYQPPCTDDASCNQYCQSHPTQCPGFVQNNSSYQNNGYNIAPSTLQSPQFQPTSGSSQQTQSNPPQPTISGYSTTQQQQMCMQTPNCSWTGSSCNCSSSQQPNH